jgi:hypothetical protein
MSHTDFRPVVYLKDRCPWSLKFRLFLLESGLRDNFEFREFAPAMIVKRLSARNWASILNGPHSPRFRSHRASICGDRTI